MKDGLLIPSKSVNRQDRIRYIEISVGRTYTDDDTGKFAADSGTHLIVFPYETQCGGSRFTSDPLIINYYRQFFMRLDEKVIDAKDGFLLCTNENETDINAALCIHQQFATSTIGIKENPTKNFVLSGTSELSDLLNLSIIRVFGGVSAILSHQIKNLREYTKDVGDLKCSESQCIIVEIFFVIDTSEKLNNGKTTDQSLRTGNCGEIQTVQFVQTRTWVLVDHVVRQTLNLSHIKGFELLQEDLSALLVEKNVTESRQSSRENRVYPTKRQNQSIPGRNVLHMIYNCYMMLYESYYDIHTEFRTTKVN